MHVVIDEHEQEHLVGCLKLGRKHWSKVQKNLAEVGVDDDRIDEELEVNKRLRRIFDPNAEEEAREAARKDPRQTDLEDEIAQGAGETGGGHQAGEVTTLPITTPPAMTTGELRDALSQIERIVASGDIDGWTPEQRAAVEEWTGRVVAAQVAGEGLPEEPECLAGVALTTERLEELVEAGPWKVHAIDTDEGERWEIVNIDTHDVDGAIADGWDADVRAARLNKGALMVADISDDEILQWAGAGPWSVVGEAGAWRIECGPQREAVDSEQDGWARAARYNRSIGTRDGWTDAAPVRVTEDGAQELKAAAEAAE